MGSQRVGHDLVTKQNNHKEKEKVRSGGISKESETASLKASYLYIRITVALKTVFVAGSEQGQVRRWS